MVHVIYLDIENFILCSYRFFNSSLQFVSKNNASSEAFIYGLFKLYPNRSYRNVSQAERLEVQLELLNSLNLQDRNAYQQLNDDLEQEKKIIKSLSLLNDKIFKESNG